MAASENLSGVAILIFRRYFRSSSLSAFCKVRVLKNICKILRKAHMPGLFSIKLKTFSLKIYYIKDYITVISMNFAKVFLYTFFTEQLRATTSDI